jgi:uncharacterized protein (TIGR03067 family)
MCVVLAVLAVTFSFAAEKPRGDAVKKELKKFEGTWKIVSLEVEGMKLPAKAFEGARLIIKGDAFTMKEEKVTHKGTFKVDPTKKPKMIDLIFTEGPAKGKTLLGIYELEGDTYTICLAVKGKKRPTTFTGKAGTDFGLEVLKRVKQ